MSDGRRWWSITRGGIIDLVLPVIIVGLVSGACSSSSAPLERSSTPQHGRSTTAATEVVAGTTETIGTTPLTGPAQDTTAPPQAALPALSLHDKVCQLFTILVYGSSATDATPSQRMVNQAHVGAPTAAEVLRQCPVGGLLYLARNNLDPTYSNVETGNLRDPKQIADLSAGAQVVATSTAPGVPLLISLDQEQGLVTRVREPLTTFSGNMALGAGGRTEDAERSSRAVADELRTIGVNTNFAPVADVNVNPNNPVIGVRSFGSDAAVVAAMSAASVRGTQAAGVAATAKHFPGHGDTGTDSHVGLPVVTHDKETLEAVDLAPFRSVIAADVDLIMTGHIAMPLIDPTNSPATLSAPLVTGLLRGELGYDGVVVTDSLWMAPVRAQYPDGEVAVRALLAGNDILLEPPNLPAAVSAITEAVASGRLTEARIDESLRRVMALKKKLGLVDGQAPVLPPAVPGGGNAENRALADDVAQASATLLRPNCQSFPLGGVGHASASVVVASDTALAQSLATDLTAEGVRASASSFSTAGYVARAKAAGSAVVIIGEAKPGDAQERAVEALVSAGVPTFVVSTGAPYEVGRLRGLDAFVAVYDPGVSALRAAARVLTGAAARGHLPVAVPSTDGDAQPLGAGVASCP